MASFDVYPWETLVAGLHAQEGGTPPVLRPPMGLLWRRQQAEGGLRARLGRMGLDLLAQGKVATLLLAGGQGSRLGVKGPKGCVVFGPEADRTLYRIHAERIAGASERAGRPVPLLLLTSPATRAETEAAFADPRAYGLAADQVRVLEQGCLPALDPDGRALLSGPDRLALSPDGHGGVWQTLLGEGGPG